MPSNGPCVPTSTFISLKFLSGDMSKARERKFVPSKLVVAEGSSRGPVTISFSRLKNCEDHPFFGAHRAIALTSTTVLRHLLVGALHGSGQAETIRSISDLTTAGKPSESENSTLLAV
jgi:hypothetical protein